MKKQIEIKVVCFLTDSDMNASLDLCMVYSLSVAFFIGPQRFVLDTGEVREVKFFKSVL